MKQIIIFLVCLICSFPAFSQLPTSTFPSRIFNGNTKAQWILLDSPMVNPILDTFYARYAGTQIVRIQGGDSAIWFYGGNRKWLRTINQRQLDDTSTAIRNNIYWQINPTTLNLQNKPIGGPNVDLINNLKVNQTGLSTSQFTGWPATFNTSFNHNIVGVYGDEPSLDILVDSNSQFQIGGLTFRTQKVAAPKLPASRFGASAGAKIEYNAFLNGLFWTSTMEFYLPDTSNNGIHIFALSGPGTHFYGDRKVFTAESKEALMFGTAILGVNSAAISGLADTSYFVGDAGSKNLYIFNLPNIVSDTTNYKPMVYNPTTGVWARSTWPATGGGGGSVVSVATNNGTGITGGTITVSGTLAIDTAGTISTKLWRQKGVDSLNALINLKVNIADTVNMLLPYLRKSDTTAMLANYIVGPAFGLFKTGKFLGADTTRGTGLPSYYYVDSSVAAGGGGTPDTTVTELPIYVVSGVKDTIKLRYADGLGVRASDTALVVVPAGSNTQVQFNNSGVLGADADFAYNSTTNVLTTGDYKFNTISNHSSLRRATVLYGGIQGTARTRDSTSESRFIIRLPFDGAGIITPTFIQDTDHELIGYDSIKAVSSDIVTYRPTVADVHSMWVQPDETLVRLVGGFGPSVGLSATTIRGYRHSTWGGAIYWHNTSRIFYSDGAVVNDNIPSAITYDSTTGILSMTVSTWMTTGTERDYKKLAVSMSQSGLHAEYRVQSSSNTLLTYKITDGLGSVVPPYMFDGNTALTFIMPTWHTQLPLGDIGGSNAWLQNFITSQSNLWGGQTDKRN